MVGRVGLSKAVIHLRRLIVYLVVFLASLYLVTCMYNLTHEVPFDHISELSVQNEIMVGSAQISCNVVSLREIGMLFDPPIKIQGIRDAQDAITGTVNLSINGRKKSINLAETGWSINNGGIWLKVIDRYQPNLRTCLRQNITVEIKDSNLDLELYSASLYVSRDRRP